MGHGCQKQCKVFFSQTKAGCLKHVFAQETSREVTEGKTQHLVTTGCKFTIIFFRLIDRRTLQHAVLSNPIFVRDLLCGILKQHGNVFFQCFVKGLAVQRSASDYPPATFCTPLELNSPFQYTRNVELPAMTRLSLPLPRRRLFTLAGIRLVALLRKVQKPSTTTSESILTDDDLCSVVRKLRNELCEGQAQLRTNG